jgi:ABC-type transport system involved in Fe-S cluster assembly fused permease/ATPase subunit
LVLQDGQITEQGQHDELMALKGQYANYVAQQLI